VVSTRSRAAKVPTRVPTTEVGDAGPSSDISHPGSPSHNATGVRRV